MISINKLKQCTEDGLKFIKTVPDVKEAEVFMSANCNLLCRLNYTSHIPCNGVEEPKSMENYGVGVNAVFNTKDGIKVGYGSEPSDISAEGVKKALEKAGKNAVHDSDFKCFPKPSGEKRTLSNYHDPKLMELTDENLVKCGWKVIDKALEIFSGSKNLSKEDKKALGLIIGGDVTIIQEKIAIASHSMPEVQTDETSLIVSFITSMVEAKNAKGSGYSADTFLKEFTGQAGSDAALNAVKSMDGIRVRTGEYDVIFGQQAVMDLLNNLIVPSLNIWAFDSMSSPFLGKMTKPIASEKLTIIDHGNAPELAGSKGITCEGLPTGKTTLVKNGVLTGLLSNYYYYQKILNDKKGREKLGVDPSKNIDALIPRNGFRYGGGGGRMFSSSAGIGATNIVVKGDKPYNLQDLQGKVKDGLYIGRIWYTYPVNGLRAGDFSCTVIGDSYIIKDGKISSPIKPNTLRINDNILNVLKNIIGITKTPKPTLVWAADEVVYAPDMAVSKIKIDEIASFTEKL